MVWATSCFRCQLISVLSILHHLSKVSWQTWTDFTSHFCNEMVPYNVTKRKKRKGSLQCCSCVSLVSRLYKTTYFIHVCLIHYPSLHFLNCSHCQITNIYLPPLFFHESVLISYSIFLPVTVGHLIAQQWSISYVVYMCLKLKIYAKSSSWAWWHYNHFSYEVMYRMKSPCKICNFCGFSTFSSTST